MTTNERLHYVNGVGDDVVVVDDGGVDGDGGNGDGDGDNDDDDAKEDVHSSMLEVALTAGRNLHVMMVMAFGRQQAKTVNLTSSENKPELFGGYDDNMTMGKAGEITVRKQRWLITSTTGTQLRHRTNRCERVC
jgi:hypothetical protein